jgi:hypothetical protein
MRLATTSGTTTARATSRTASADSMAAGPEDRARVLEHELEHAEGYGHSEDPYDVMYPQMLITGY